jgi:hypothetical protein
MSRGKRTCSSLAWLAAGLLAAPASAQFVEECATPPPAVEDLLRSPRRICTGNTQGVLAPRDQSGTLLIDDQGRFRGVVRLSGEYAAAFSGGISHDGSVDDTIFWGVWTRGPLVSIDDGTVSRRDVTVPIPFVAGVEPGVFFRREVFRGGVRLPMPVSGAATYRLLGRPAIFSDESAVRAHTDSDGVPIDPGLVENATVRVDYGTGVGALDITFVVRGVTSRMTVPLLRRTTTSPFAANCPESLPPHKCPSAEVQFYGRQGEFMGLEFRVPYQGVPNYDAMVAARLENGRGYSLMALRREPGR